MPRDKDKQRKRWNRWYRKKFDTDPIWRARLRERKRRWRNQISLEKRKETGRRGHFKHSYGLSIEELDQMVADQQSRCLICKRKSKLCVDHCHRTGAIRGLLCRTCNMALGWYEAREDEIRDYLKSNFRGV